MYDPIPVTLPGRSEGGHPFGPQTAAAVFGVAGIGRGGHDAGPSLRVMPVNPIFWVNGRKRERPMNLPPKVTDRAFARLAEINENGAGRPLRVAVAGGGCSGFQYEIRLDDVAEDDLVLESGGQKVVVDPVSLPYLAGAVIDFTDELIGARFVIDNPNASSSCGCGTSFSM